MNVAELKLALNDLPDNLQVVFVLPNSLEEIIRTRGQMSVTDAKIGPADFGQLVQLTSNV